MEKNRRETLIEMFDKEWGSRWVESHKIMFANLIIHECLHAVENTNDRYRKEYFAGKIKDHFGVGAVNDSHKT